MNLNDFKVGDILEFTQRSKRGTELRTAQVSAVNYNGNGLVTYWGHTVDHRLSTGSGAFDPAEVGTKPFGFYCAVRKIGHATPFWANHWSPKPGDRGYDLMC
jgi:hypothetical protein